MNRKNNSKKRQALASRRNRYLVALLTGQQDVVSELPGAKLLSSIQNQLMEAIISATEEAEEIEELIELEMLYQELDEYFAVSEPDASSIDKAKIGYLQIAGTIRQMRRAPAEYMASNIAAHETRMNPRKIDKSKALKQIWANKIRLQNRANFASPEWRAIWTARIRLADRTEQMYRALHNKLVDDCEQDMTP
jgi:hypothetical protein